MLALSHPIVAVQSELLSRYKFLTLYFESEIIVVGQNPINYTGCGINVKSLMRDIFSFRE